MTVPESRGAQPANVAKRLSIRRLMVSTAIVAIACWFARLALLFDADRRGPSDFNPFAMAGVALAAAAMGILFHRGPAFAVASLPVGLAVQAYLPIRHRPVSVQIGFAVRAALLLSIFAAVVWVVLFAWRELRTGTALGDAGNRNEPPSE
jgi:hypothetical protein